jgi:hypothetical protein
MNIGHLTEQHLDAVAAKHGAKWTDEYRRKFAALVEDVKNYNPPLPAGYERKTNEGIKR